MGNPFSIQSLNMFQKPAVQSVRFGGAGGAQGAGKLGGTNVGGSGALMGGRSNADMQDFYNVIGNIPKDAYGYNIPNVTSANVGTNFVPYMA